MDVELFSNIGALLGAFVFVFFGYIKHSGKPTIDNMPVAFDTPNQVALDSTVTTQVVKANVIQADVLQSLVEEQKADRKIIQSNERAIGMLEQQLQAEKQSREEMEKRMQAENASLKKENKQQSEKIVTLEARIEQLEAELKRNNLKIPEPKPINKNHRD